MTPQALRHINESREQLLPKRELFGGEVMVLEKPSSQAITVKVDGKPVVFEIPKQASNDAFFSTFWNTLNKEKIIYSPSTGSFHSLKSLPYKQAEEFLTLSYSQAKERIPKHLQNQFTPEFFAECQGKSRTILAQKALKWVGKNALLMGHVGLYSLFFSEIHKNSSDVRSYTKSLAGIAGFELGARLGAKVGMRAPGLVKIPATLIGGIGGAMAGEALEGTKMLAMDAKLWSTMPRRALGVEEPNTVAWRAIFMDPELVYTTNVDATDSPVDWTDRAPKRDIAKWNQGIEIYKKQLTIDIVKLARSYRENTGVFTYLARVSSLHENAANKAKMPEVKQAEKEKFKKETLEKQLGKLIFSWVNPINAIPANQLYEDILNGILQANSGKINEYTTQLGPIIEQQIQGYTQKMLIPNKFEMEWVEKSEKVTDFSRFNNNTEVSYEGSNLIEYHDQLLTDVWNNFATMRKVLPVSRIKDIELIEKYVARIMSWEDPLGKLPDQRNIPAYKWDNTPFENWQRILSDKTPIQIADGNGKTITVPLCEMLVSLYNKAAEFRRINRWMYIANKNGFGQEWRIAPKKSIAGHIEDYFNE